ncbi:MAG: transglutaminase domain-containing protein, partial [Bdellovibrionales bacterium]|nr:transglutaminase domain-containing protein [Bdellovibrionales bacterium]
MRTRLVDPFFLTLAAFVLIFGAPASAVAHWASSETAPLHIRSHIANVVVNTDASWKMSGTLELLVNTAIGQTLVTNYRVPFKSELEEIRILSADTVSPSQVARVIPLEAIQIREGEASAGVILRENNPFNLHKAYVIPFGQLEIGAVARIKYEIVQKRPRIPGLFAMTFEWGLEYPELAGRLSFDSPVLLHLDISPGARSALRFTQGKTAQGRFVWNADVIAPIYRKIEAEPGGALSTRLVPRLQISNQKSWDSVLEYLAPKYQTLSTDPLPIELQRIADRARGDGKTTLSLNDQLNTVIEGLTQTFKYSQEWINRDDGLTPQRLSDFVRVRRGDCKDFAHAGASILRSLGIEADVAFVFKQAPTERLWIEERPATVSLNLFNHAIVRVVD